MHSGSPPTLKFLFNTVSSQFMILFFSGQLWINNCTLNSILSSLLLGILRSFHFINANHQSLFFIFTEYLHTSSLDNMKIFTDVYLRMETQTSAAQLSIQISHPHFKYFFVMPFTSTVKLSVWYILQLMAILIFVA